MSAEDLDNDMKGIPAALTRAAKRAREIARKTGTHIVVVRDGKVVRERPDAYEDSSDEPPRVAEP